jgi:hypothetical protein
VKPPSPRGPISEALIASLKGDARRLAPPGSPSSDPLADEDLELALFLLYELHYRGIDGVPDGREWDPELIALRRSLEDHPIEALEALAPRRVGVLPERVGALLFELSEADDSPSLSGHLAARGTLEQFREFVVHRSAYQLKEADPHSWAIPRLTGAPKSALLEVQYDEYGSGRPERMHSRLFAESMEALGLDSAYGAYIELIPGLTLATVNLMSCLGLRRGRRGAIVGHLAMFEITSPVPNRRYAQGLRRLGMETATEFFDEHVEADSVHENLAAYDLAGGLAKQQPELTADILFGAEALLALEGRWAVNVLERWAGGRSSLLAPLSAIETAA